MTLYGIILAKVSLNKCASILKLLQSDLAWLSLKTLLEGSNSLKFSLT